MKVDVITVVTDDELGIGTEVRNERYVNTDKPKEKGWYVCKLDDEENPYAVAYWDDGFTFNMVVDATHIHSWHRINERGFEL